MAKYRKKPVVIEAEQFFEDRYPWPKGVRAEYHDSGMDHNGHYSFHIDTLEGPMRVSEGDFIITGVRGEKYPCKPDIFAATYDPAE